MSDETVVPVGLREREYSIKARRKLAKQGKAMKDGSFPIKSRADLAHAVRLAGNARNPRKARRFIMKRARAEGWSDDIPFGWSEEGESSG